MPVTQYVDREKEFTTLEKIFGSEPVFVVIYGRRRIGKTTLILEFCRRLRKKCCYYHALPAKHEVNLRGLTESLENCLGLDVLSKVKFDTLDSLLYFVGGSVKEDTILIIDEFTYWCRAEPRVLGELQRFVDHYIRRGRLSIVIVGSLVGVMVRSVLGGGSPLYGRANLRLKVAELEPWYLPQFYPWLSPKEWVEYYSMFGGIPYYHSVVLYGEKPLETIKRIFLSKASPLQDEPLFMLREEFREPSTYYSILKAISQGYQTPSKISEITGIHRQHVSKYLLVLEQLGFIEKLVPLYSKKGFYRIKDNILRLWLHLIEPVITRVPDEDLAYNEITKKFHEYVSQVFEDIAAMFALYMLHSRRINYNNAGKYIHKNIEIDFIAIDDEKKELYAFEFKWSSLSEEDVRSIANKLIEKMSKTELKNYKYHLHIIAKEKPMQPVTDVEVFDINEMPWIRP